MNDEASKLVSKKEDQGTRRKSPEDEREREKG